MPDITVPPNPRREHCVASLSQIKMIGTNKGQQVRIERSTIANDTTLALYTIKAVHKNKSDIVFVGYSNSADLTEHLGLSNTDPFTGRVNAQVTADGLTDEQAKERSEFVEHLNDNGLNQGLVVIAPHGGKIEEHTDLQVEHLGKLLHSEQVSEWICKGFKKPRLTVGTLLRRIFVKSHFRSLKRSLGASLNIPSPFMDGVVIPFASEEEEDQTI